jgi:hypothetical protein
MSSDLLDALAKPPPPPSELDELMSRDPLDLAKDPTAIDKIIGYQRQARAKREAKPAGRGKRTDLTDYDNTKPIDLAALGLVKPTIAPQPSLKPTSGGFRRL